MITAKSSKLELIRQYNNISVSSIIQQKPPSIAALKKQHGHEIVENCVAVIVADLNTSFSGELSTEQVEEIVAELTSGFNVNHSLESIYLACKKIKYSTDYKLTIPKILKMASQTFDEISDAVANNNYNQHLATKFTDVRETKAERNKKNSDALSIAKVWHEINKNK